MFLSADGTSSKVPSAVAADCRGGSDQQQHNNTYYRSAFAHVLLQPLLLPVAGDLNRWVSKKEKRPVEIDSNTTIASSLALPIKEIDHEQKNNKDKFWKTKT